MTEELVGKEARRTERRAAQAPIRLIAGGLVAIPLSLAATRMEGIAPLTLVLLAAAAWTAFCLLPYLAREEGTRLLWNRSTGTLLAQTGVKRIRPRAEILVTNVVRAILDRAEDTPNLYALTIERKAGDPVTLVTGSDAAELRAAGTRIGILANAPFESRL